MNDSTDLVIIGVIGFVIVIIIIIGVVLIMSNNNDSQPVLTPPSSSTDPALMAMLAQLQAQNRQSQQQILDLQNRPAPISAPPPLQTYLPPAPAPAPYIQAPSPTLPPPPTIPTKTYPPGWGQIPNTSTLTVPTINQPLSKATITCDKGCNGSDTFAKGQYTGGSRLGNINKIEEGYIELPTGWIFVAYQSDDYKGDSKRITKTGDFSLPWSMDSFELI